MAELVDALALGASGRKAAQVQVLLHAHVGYAAVAYQPGDLRRAYGYDRVENGRY